MFGNVINIIFGIVGVVIFSGVFCRVAVDKFSEVKTVNAVVLDKHSYANRVQSKMQAPYSRKKYVVIFMTDTKRLSFYVSEYSYQNYRKNQKGILSYKGSKIIDFK